MHPHYVHSNAHMQKDTPFAVTSRQLLDAWLRTDAETAAQPGDVYRDALDGLTIKTRLTIFRITGDEPMAWHIRAVRDYGFVSSLLNFAKLLPDGPLGAIADRRYLERDVVPQIREVIRTGQPKIELVKAKFFGFNVGYDRVLLPQKAQGRPAWVISCTYARFLLGSLAHDGVPDIADEAIIQLLSEGETAKEIALALDMSPRTVEHRLEKMKQKFGAKNIVHLVSMFLGKHVERLSHAGPLDAGRAPDTAKGE